MNEKLPLAALDYLQHIDEAIARIDSYLLGLDRQDFKANSEKQDAVIRNLEVIGEAAANIRRKFPEFADAHPELELTKAYGMRNALAHGYFSVDLDVVWNTVQSNLPILKVKIHQIIAD